MLIYIIIPWILLSSLLDRTSVDLLLRDGVCSIREDSSFSEPVNRFIINAIDSVDFGKVGNAVIKYSGVRERYRLVGTKCLSLCGLVRTGELRGATINLNSDQLLFNECDSSLYLFGAGMEQFSKVMKNEISPNFNAQFIMEILNLYVNTVNIHEPLIILKSYGDFEALYGNPITYDPGPLYSPEDRKDDFKAARKWITPLYVHLNGDTYDIEFDTWGLNSGIITLWEFQVSRENIKLLVKETMVREIGPFLMRLGS